MDLIWITQGKYETDYKIRLTFNDGFESIADLKDSFSGKIFEPLKDKEYFKTFKQNKWTIEWNCNVDFAPEYLYELAKKN